MSDCGFENPKLGFQVGSTLLSRTETRAAAGNQALVSLPVQFGAADHSLAARRALSW